MRACARMCAPRAQSSRGAAEVPSPRCRRRRSSEPRSGATGAPCGRVGEAKAVLLQHLAYLVVHHHWSVWQRQLGDMLRLLHLRKVPRRLRDVEDRLVGVLAHGEVQSVLAVGHEQLEQLQLAPISCPEEWVRQALVCRREVHVGASVQERLDEAVVSLACRDGQRRVGSLGASGRGRAHKVGVGGGSQQRDHLVVRLYPGLRRRGQRGALPQPAVGLSAADQDGLQHLQIAAVADLNDTAVGIGALIQQKHEELLVLSGAEGLEVRAWHEVLQIRIAAVQCRKLRAVRVDRTLLL
mmetsp:Transcript_27571/g.82200  ORF Transcript_27571/g.82200 Transcript_27571/m.82200 type:complete len:296 (-) Transcript_27571:452-1339(-)